ncbi:MAG: head GIN domain-containing protein [Flavobacteriaceae bacterium]
MKKIITLTLALAALTTVNAQWKKVKGNGNVVTIERSTADYDQVAVAGWFDVELVDGAEGALKIRGEENLLEYIKTEVKDGKLVIKVKKGINLKPSSWGNDGGILVTVPVESISSVSLSGSGDVVSKTVLKANSFETKLSGSGDVNIKVEAEEVVASLSGSGDVDLSGSAGKFVVKVSGSGDVKAFDLSANTVEATISGSADVKVTANEMLYARVSGSGDIEYRGNPTKVDSKASGSGEISKG